MIIDEKSVALDMLYTALVKMEMISKTADLEEIKRQILFDGSLRNMNQELENGIIKHIDHQIKAWTLYHKCEKEGKNFLHEVSQIERETHEPTKEM